VLSPVKFGTAERCLPLNVIRKTGKDYRIGTLCYNWAMPAHASQAFSTSTVPILKIYRKTVFDKYICMLY